jgi:AraC-like DNA-binding protein
MSNETASLGAGSQSLPFDVFTTEGLRPRESFEVTRDMVRQVHDLRLPAGALPQGFKAYVRAWSPGPFAFFAGTFDERVMVRDERMVRTLQVDNYRLLIPLQTTTLRFSTQDEHQQVMAGEVVFSDLARSEEVHCSSGTFAQILIGRDRLDALLPQAARLHGVVPRGALAQLVADHLRAFTRDLSQIKATEATRVAEATLQLIAALASSGPVTEVARPAVETALRRRIIRHINENLLDPTLNSDRLCRDFGLSRASLYRLFQPLDGVSNFIGERRLRAVHHELSQPGLHHLGQVSLKYGYSSQGQMTRAFRNLFGYAPRDTQQAPAHQSSGNETEAERRISWSRVLRQLDG